MLSTSVSRKQTLGLELRPVALQAHRQYGDHREKQDDQGSRRCPDHKIDAPLLVKIGERLVRRLRDRHDERVVGQLSVSDDSSNVVGVALRLVMTRGIGLGAGDERQLAAIGDGGHSCSHAARPQRSVEPEHFHAATRAQLRFLVELHEVLGRHRDQHDSGERPIGMIQAAAEHDGRRNRLLRPTTGLLMSSKPVSRSACRRKYSRSAMLNGAEGLVTGNDVPVGVGDAQHHVPAARRSSPLR